MSGPVLRVHALVFASAFPGDTPALRQCSFEHLESAEEEFGTGWPNHAVSAPYALRAVTSK